MPDARFPVEVVRGVPVVAAPAEIDITNAEALRAALSTAPAAANGHGRQRDEGDAGPKSSRHSLPPAGELPGTLKHSPEEARDTFTRALASAVQASGEGDQAPRAAYAELKRTFEKRGDHWIP